MVFKPSQAQRIISGPSETFIKRYIVERANKQTSERERVSEVLAKRRWWATPRGD